MAVRGLQSVLVQAGGWRHFDDLADQWIDRLALHLVSGAGSR